MNCHYTVDGSLLSPISEANSITVDFNAKDTTVSSTLKSEHPERDFKYVSYLYIFIWDETYIDF